MSVPSRQPGRHFLCTLCVGVLCGNPLCKALSFLVGVSGEETSFLLFSDGEKTDVSIFLLSFSFFRLSLLSFLDSRSLSVDVSGVSSDGGPASSFGGFAAASVGALATAMVGVFAASSIPVGGSATACA